MRNWISLLAVLLLALMVGCKAMAPSGPSEASPFSGESQQTEEEEPQSWQAEPVKDGERADEGMKAALEQALTALSSDPESWTKMELLDPEDRQHFRIEDNSAFLYELCFKDEVEKVGGNWVNDYLITEDTTRIYVYDAARDEAPWVLKAHQENGEWVMDNSL